jgi:hypothetical protein
MEDEEFLLELLKLDLSMTCYSCAIDAKQAEAPKEKYRMLTQKVRMKTDQSEELMNQVKLTAQSVRHRTKSRNSIAFPGFFSPPARAEERRKSEA